MFELWRRQSAYAPVYAGRRRRLKYKRICRQSPYASVCACIRAHTRAWITNPAWSVFTGLTDECSVWGIAMVLSPKISVCYKIQTFPAHSTCYYHKQFCNIIQYPKRCIMVHCHASKAMSLILVVSWVFFIFWPQKTGHLSPMSVSEKNTSCDQVRRYVQIPV